MGKFVTNTAPEVSGWVERLAAALDVLAQSMTASRINAPNLTYMQYRALAEAAAKDAVSQALFESYLPSLNSNPADVIQILRAHPTIKRALAGSNDDAIMILTPSSAFRVEFEMLARYLVKATIKIDGHYAASMLNEYLTRSDENNLPGQEVTLFRGLEVEQSFEIGEGEFIAPYQELVNLGLQMRPDDPRWENYPDYRSMGVAGLVRNLTWGPGAKPAMTS